MTEGEGRELRKMLAIEEADAWFEYLDATRTDACGPRYEDIEPWAWARLRQRLHAVNHKRLRLRSVAA